MMSLIDEARQQCPLCGGENLCQAQKSSQNECWCFSTNIPDELLARIPARLVDKACICKECVEAFCQQRR